jgi:hypothetical protein
MRAVAYRAAGAAALPGAAAAYFYRHEIIAFIVNHANELKIFVEHAFWNPALIRVIEVIAQTAGSS